MSTIDFIIYLVIGLAGMEVFSYVFHRFLFHGVLWFIHKTHHSSSSHLFEWNDLFSAILAFLSIFMIYKGSAHPLHSPLFGIGLGITIYGIGYFFIHDILIHKRFISLHLRNPLFKKIRKAHQKHHQTIKKKGEEPFGLFMYYNYNKDKD
ncbi:MAG TPA: sterol desaturase family protein [Balneolales bacterium]|nr:sterol desaturase family protein [Balneolales bacterium]